MGAIGESAMSVLVNSGSALALMFVGLDADSVTGCG
jgi:hypothetical protein